MKKIINIKGMHCISCEILLEKELKEINWVKLLMVSHKKGIMEIEYKKESDYEKVVELIKKAWFNIEEQTEDKIYNFMLNFIAILVVILLVMLTKAFDLYSFIPDTSTLSYSSAFLVWIIASVSTCLAITWWIIIWFSRYIDSTHWTLWHVKVQLWFQIWRVLWFFLLGGILWLVWKTFAVSFSISWIITFVVWALLLYMGANILWLVPSLSKFWVHMPKSIAGKLENLWKPKYAPIVWALTFFLPCWFTQTMQLLAVSSWSFLTWWLVMMFFALGTFPVLFSVWLWTSYFKEKKVVILNKIIWILVILFWLFTIFNSYNLLSFTSSWADNINDKSIEKNNVEQKTINVSHNGYNMEPYSVELEAWANYKIIITPTSDWRWCMTTQVIPKLSNKISYVKAWLPIVYDMYDAKPWTYNVVCSSMWMLQWQIIVK